MQSPEQACWSSVACWSPVVEQQHALNNAVPSSAHDTSLPVRRLEQDRKQWDFAKVLSSARMASAYNPADLERIWVAADGSVKALYADNSLLLLSSNGTSFTRVSAEGTKTVQLSECCLSRWKPLVAELLAFRNQHLDVPCFPAWLQKHLQDQHGLLFTTGYPVSDTTWSESAANAVEAGLVKLLDHQTIQLFSSCGSALITLQYSGLRFAVCYPLLLSHHPASNTYAYIQHTQVFSRSQYPARWHPALTVATEVAQLAAHSNAQHMEQQQQPHVQQDLVQLQRQLQDPQLLLMDVTNNPRLVSASSSPARQNYSAAGISCARAAAAAGSVSSSPRHHGIPMQRQHRPWQAVDPLVPCHRQRQLWQGQRAGQTATVSCSGFAGGPVDLAPALQDAVGAQLQLWCPPGSPGSPTGALYAVAEQQQQQGCHVPVSEAVGHNNSLACVVQLPVLPGVQQPLPQQLLQQRQRPAVLHPARPSSSRQPDSSISSSSSSSGWNSHVAAALSEALGQRQRGSSSTAADGACMGNWWLEPHLLLPADELLQMIWSPDATFIFLEDTKEVEVWLHADDSCLFSFQGGAFVTHLQNHAAPAAAAGAAAGPAAQHSGFASDALDMFAGHPIRAAAGGSSSVGTVGPGASQQQLSGRAGLVEGCLNASQMSRVYAASTLPADLAVPVLSAGGARCGDAVLPLGRIVTEALRFRGTMVRVSASLSAHSAQPAAQLASAAALHSSSTTTGRTQLQPARLAHPGSGCAQQLMPVQTHHQQQQLSLEVTEDQEVPGVGRFTAYADGCVRALFADRTILRLDADRAQAKLILPDGSKQEVPVSRPLGVEEYVQAALEFAIWSSHTPIQRAAALRMQALVAAELRGSARMAAICEWGSNPGQLPAAATHDAGNKMAAAGPAPLMVTSGNMETNRREPAGCLHDEEQPWHVGGTVQELLEANRRLLDRL